MSPDKPGTKNGLTSDGLIWAIPYRDKKPLPPVSLSDGVIVAYLTPEQTHRHFPDDIPAFIVVRTDEFGKMQTITLELGPTSLRSGPKDVFVLEGIYGSYHRMMSRPVYSNRSRPIHWIE